MSTFLSILLKILIILGITVGSIIALVLLILALVLFVPIRYRAQGAYQNKTPSLKASVSWLLHIVSFKATYSDKFEIALRVFGIKINLNKKNNSSKSGEKEVSEIPDNFDDNNKDSFDVDLDFDDAEIDEFINVKEKASGEKASSTAKEAVNQAEAADKNEKNIIEGESKASDEPSGKDSTKTKIYDKIKKYVEIIQTDLFARCFEKCKDKLIKLLKLILPYKLNVNAVVGFDDPATTGKILAISGMLTPVIYRHISVVGDFEHEIIDIQGRLKGRICLFKIIFIGASIYFDKRIRRLVKLFKTV